MLGWSVAFETYGIKNYLESYDIKNEGLDFLNFQMEDDFPSLSIAPSTSRNSATALASVIFEFSFFFIFEIFKNSDRPTHHWGCRQQNQNRPKTCRAGSGTL